MIRAGYIKTDLIPPNLLFQHSSIPIPHGIYLGQSLLSVTRSSFRPVGPTARGEDQVFNVRIKTIRWEKSLENLDTACPEAIIINEVQLLLAEKRTSLAAMRTGIAVFALPLTVMSVLIATSKYYDIVNVLHLLVPLLSLCGALILLGSYLIIRSVLRLLRHDRHIAEIKRKYGSIAEFID
jgi:uncharacterized membrane protein YidH (DUF202 family)